MKSQEEFNRSQAAVNAEIQTRLRQMSLGMGTAFELYNKAWLRKLFPGIQANSFIRGHYFPHPECTIYSKQTLAELDIFCATPLLVAEVKTVINEKQFLKVDKFVKKVDLVKKTYISDCKAFLMTFGL